MHYFSAKPKYKKMDGYIPLDITISNMIIPFLDNTG